jgi:chromatin remodeling complex protein RSC6
MSASASAPAKSAKRVAKKTDETPVAAAPAPAPATPKAAAPKETKPKAAASKAAAPAPAVAADAAKAPVVAAPAPAADASAAPAEEVRLEAEVKAVTASLLSVRETLSGLITESKKLEKRAAKLQKLADKRKRKVRAEGEEGKPAKPSIFKIPTNITPALCAFMGRPAGSQESRANVSKFITTYVREHNLKDAKHGINADAPLKKLLALKDGDALTYFNLQKYLNVHYIKAEKPAVTA